MGNKHSSETRMKTNQPNAKPNTTIPISTYISSNKSTTNNNDKKQYIVINIYTSYIGAVDNGKPHGVGVITYDNGVSVNGVFYKGELTAGEATYTPKKNHPPIQPDQKVLYQNDRNHSIEGKNLIYIDDNHRVYIGDFVNGQITGKGVFIDYEDHIFTGIFENNDLLVGKCVAPNGTVYEGVFTNRYLNGEGKAIYKNGTISTGTFHKDKLINGKKVRKKETLEGEFYENGNIKKGKKTQNNGVITEGEYYEDGTLKRGKYINHDGVIYEGEFKENRLYGEGKVTYSNNNYCYGTFNCDSRHGRCIYVSIANRAIYQGKYNRDSRNGKFLIWQDNKLIADGNFKGEEQVSGVKYEYLIDDTILIKNFDNTVIKIISINDVCNMPAPPVNFPNRYQSIYPNLNAPTNTSVNENKTSPVITTVNKSTNTPINNKKNIIDGQTQPKIHN